MKFTAVIAASLLCSVLSYTPCETQDEFDTVMCKSATCTNCDLPFCITQCVKFQEDHMQCRCRNWPCSRRCYDLRACPSEEDAVECVEPTLPPPPKPEIAGDADGDGEIGKGEVAGDLDGDGEIEKGEVKGDMDGDGELEGKKEGLPEKQIPGDLDGDGKVEEMEGPPEKPFDNPATEGEPPSKKGYEDDGELEGEMMDDDEFEDDGEWEDPWGDEGGDELEGEMMDEPEGGWGDELDLRARKASFGHRKHHKGRHWVYRKGHHKGQHKAHSKQAMRLRGHNGKA